MLQSSRTALLHMLLKTHCVQTRSAMSTSAGSSDNSSSSVCSSCQSKTSIADVIAAHNENSTTVFNPPEIPTCCCMSGCAKCVYVQYVVEMVDCFKDNGTTALKVIDAIEDETMKSFLKMELEYILLRKK